MWGRTPLLQKQNEKHKNQKKKKKHLFKENKANEIKQKQLRQHMQSNKKGWDTKPDCTTIRAQTQ